MLAERSRDAARIRASSVTLGEQHLEFWRDRRKVARSPEEYEQLRCFVYVIQGDEGTPIKVGLSEDPPARLKTLQTGNPQTLRLLYVIPGGHAIEAALHRRLEGSQVLGEWYGEPGIEEFLEWMNDYASRAVKAYARTRELPVVPSHRRNRPRGLSGGKRKAKWRTANGKDPEPVTVRFVKPDPRIPPEEAQRMRDSVKGLDGGAYLKPVHPTWNKRISPSQGFGN